MAEVLGVVLAVLAALFFGTYFVPLKKTKGVDASHYQFFVGVAALVIGIIAVAVFGIGFQINVLGIVTGIVWATANLLVVHALRYVGLSKVPITNGTIILVSFFLGLLILKEAFQSVIQAVVGLLVLLIGLPLFATDVSRDRDMLKGVALLISAGILWGSMFAIPLLYNIEASSIILSMSLGVFLFGTAMLLLRRKQLRIEARTVYTSLISGTIWSAGNILNIAALGLIGLALTGPLTQLVIMVNIGWGLFYFKEGKNRNHVLKIILGGLLMVAGNLLLVFSK